MADIKEIAVAAWRLERWLNNINVERKMAAKSALRAINKYLEDNEVEVLDITGNKFDTGLAVTVVNNESDETDEEKLLISEMVKPIILQKGSVLQYGQVVLGETVKQEKSNSVINPDENKVTTEIPEAKSVPAQKETNIEEQSARGKGTLLFKILSVVLLMAIIIGLLLMNSSLSQKINGLTETVSQSKSSTTEQVEQIDKKIESLTEQVEQIDEKFELLPGGLDKQTEKDAEVNNPQIKSAYVKYIVQRRDTLTRICASVGIDYNAKRDEILSINNIEDPDLLLVGQELLLPIETH